MGLAAFQAPLLGDEVQHVMQQFKGLYLDRNAKALTLLAEQSLTKPRMTEVESLRQEADRRGPNKEWPGPRELGVHPAIYHRIWHTLAEPLPEDCRTVACGFPALQYPGTGLLLAFGVGMYLLIRVNDPAIDEAYMKDAIAHKFKVLTFYFVRRSMGSERVDVRQLLGPDWRVGRHVEAEIEWLKASYQLAASE